MKALALDLYVILPDDFEGDLSDALRWLADYHSKVKEDREVSPSSYSSISVKEKNKIMWGECLKSFKEEGKRLHGGIAFASWNQELKQWENISL